jgi:hypothetical protein
MSIQAPISHQLDLYRYWLAKRGSRSRPARSDINPADIPTLVPSLIIVDKIDDRLRWRLVGTAAVLEVGRDLTGSFVGSYAPECSATYERVFTTAHAIFSTGELEVKFGSNHNMSLLVLPLSDNGTNVNMAVSTLVACFNFGVTASTDWLECARARLHDVVDIDSAAELEKRCLDWERYCDNQRRRAEPI